MTTRNELSEKRHHSAAENNQEDCAEGLFLKFQDQIDKQTGQNVVNGITLSDGTTFENMTQEARQKLAKVLKRTTATESLDYAIGILGTISSGMKHTSGKEKLNHTALMLSALKPGDEMEALLLGQFLALQDAGLHCLGQAQRQGMFYHEERLLTLASKLFAQVNATMQALMRYRSGGQQVVQVLHVHNEGQAIVAQNLSHSGMGEGTQKKTLNEPLG